jgi:hypothetical protein
MARVFVEVLAMAVRAELVEVVVLLEGDVITLLEG